MNLRDIPTELLPKIFNGLDDHSLCAVSGSDSFFYAATSEIVAKRRKIKYFDNKLSNESNKLSLETIKDYVDFLAKESSVMSAARCLILAIQNAEEKVEDARSIRHGDERQIFVSNDPVNAEKQYQFQANRLEYLNEFYFKKFGLFGQIYRMIYAIEYDNNKSSYSIALELLHLIKLAFSKEHHPDILKVLNDYNKDLFEFYKNNKDENFKNYHLFLGTTESLITVDPTTMEIQICGKPIDDVIHYVSQQKLPDQMANTIFHDHTRLLRSMWVYYDYSEEARKLPELKNSSEFQQFVNERIAEVKSNAQLIMERIDKNSPQSGNSLKM